jgi:hypothetical protein
MHCLASFQLCHVQLPQAATEGKRVGQQQMGQMQLVRVLYPHLMQQQQAAAAAMQLERPAAACVVPFWPRGACAGVCGGLRL